MIRYELRHYRSFQKVNKNTFWVKAYYMNMEDPIEMKPKVFFRGHPKLSKKSKNTLLGSKLRETCIFKVGHFWKFAQSQQCPKMYFSSNGPNFLCLQHTPSLVHDPYTFPWIIGFIYLIYFDFYHLKNQIKSNKWYKIMKGCFDLILH